jgi:hypothetical protein
VLDDLSGDAASVICSWPLSGQYGPGARMLYYVLIIICIGVPHIAWMRGACLAAALLFPAVAAIHALVLAVVSQTRGMQDTVAAQAFLLRAPSLRSCRSGHIRDVPTLCDWRTNSAHHCSIFQKVFRNQRQEFGVCLDGSQSRRCVFVHIE